MSEPLPIIELLDEPILVQLTNRDFDSLEDPSPFDASAKTIELELRGADGTAVDTTGKVSWLDATLSKAQFARLSGDLVSTNSPYRARWLVTDNDGTHPYPSTSKASIWNVFPKT